MKDTFIKLLSHNQSFNRNELELINDLLKDGYILKDSDDKYKINEKYRIGILEIDNKFAILNDLVNKHKNIKLDFENINQSSNGDLVIVKRVFNPRNKIKGKVVKILKTNNINSIIYIKSLEAYSFKTETKLNIKKEIISKYTNGDILIVNSEKNIIIDFLGNINDPKIDEKISLCLYDEYFRYEKEDYKLEQTNIKNISRRDLRDFNFCTIDPSSAKDHDDAIYFDNINSILYVAIADVSHFVKEGSTLDNLAYKRSLSAYFPHKVFPMLPKSLSEELCSLKPNVDRLAYVFEIHLDVKSVSIIKSNLYEAIIKSKAKYSYGRIDRVLNDKLDQYSKIDKNIFDNLKLLYNITKKFRIKRLKNGYEFKNRLIKQKLDINHELINTKLEISTNSHQLIEECMLLANMEAGKKLNTLGIYRIHEEPSYKEISKLVEEVNTIGIKISIQSTIKNTIKNIQNRSKNSIFKEEIDQLIIKDQTKAKYYIKDLGHFGLGFNKYAHFTSPIRRYSDLILHRILKSNKLPKDLDNICEYISKQERKINSMIWDFEDRKFVRWAKNNIGKTLNAKIVETSKGIVKISDKIEGANIYLDNYKNEKLFVEVKIVIKSINILNKKIVASIKT